MTCIEEREDSFIEGEAREDVRSGVRKGVREE